jgi:hypothetical protein
MMGAIHAGKQLLQTKRFSELDHIECPFLEELVFGLDSAVKAYKSLERGVGGGRS